MANDQQVLNSGTCCNVYGENDMGCTTAVANDSKAVQNLVDIQVGLYTGLQVMSCIWTPTNLHALLLMSFVSLETGLRSLCRVTT